MLNVVQVGWNLGRDDEETPVASNVGQDKTDERKACENFLQWRERNFLINLVGRSVLQNVITFFLQNIKVDALKHV